MSIRNVVDEEVSMKSTTLIIARSIENKGKLQPNNLNIIKQSQRRSYQKTNLEQFL